jgi:hypothetical protein
MTTATKQAPDFDVIESGIRARILGLREQRKALALDALTSKTAAKKLEDVETRLLSCDAELDRLGLARDEAARRAQAEADAAEDETRREALVRYRELQTARLAAAKRFDKTAAAFVDAVADYADACVEQRAAHVAAGLGTAGLGAPVPKFRLAGAFLAAMDRRPAVRAVFDLPPHPPSHKRPLAETEPSPE